MKDAIDSERWLNKHIATVDKQRIVEKGEKY